MLINGKVFYFWGATIPRASSNKDGAPFLLEGQHKYQFGWHHYSSETKIYKALKPDNAGVLVYRVKDFPSSRNINNRADMQAGFDDSPNWSINIHWSGIGSYNYSAGCQVISGASYINHQGKVIDCSHYAAKNKDALGRGKTHGAYNVLADLIANYSKPGTRTISYTLVRDSMAFLSDKWTKDKITQLEESMSKKLF